MDLRTLSQMPQPQLRQAMIDGDVRGTEQWLHVMQRLVRGDAGELLIVFTEACPRACLEVCFRTLLSLFTLTPQSVATLLASQPRNVLVDPLPPSMYPDAGEPLVDCNAAPLDAWSGQRAQLVVWHLSSIIEQHHETHSRQIADALTQLQAGSIADDPTLTFRVVASVQAILSQANELSTIAGLEQRAMDAVDLILRELAAAATLGGYATTFFVQLLRVASALLQTQGRVQLSPCFPVKFLFQLAGGRNGARLVKLREMVCNVIALLSTTATPAAALGARVVGDIAIAFTQIRSLSKLCVIRFFEVLADIDNLLTIDFAGAETYLYERAAHCMLDYAQQPGMDLHEHRAWAVVLAVLRRLAEARPDLNVIEPVFWRLTTSLGKMIEPEVAALRPALTALARTRRNRTVLREMWALCDEAEMRPWQRAFGRSLTLVAREPSPAMCALTQLPARQLYTFGAPESAGVGLETMLTHVAVVGWTNPFTNEPIQWRSLELANPALARPAVPGRRPGE